MGNAISKQVLFESYKNLKTFRSELVNAASIGRHEAAEISILDAYTQLIKTYDAFVSIISNKVLFAASDSNRKRVQAALIKNNELQYVNFEGDEWHRVKDGLLIGEMKHVNSESSSEKHFIFDRESIGRLYPNFAIYDYRLAKFDRFDFERDANVRDTDMFVSE